ncbi:fatty acyl-AMP ligase [Puniceicoccaceae bacterium K14]|nr:fatty acyl-AMP ligase [Puniceicoccaceae bacterium K14]
MSVHTFIKRIAQQAQDCPDASAVIYLDRREREYASLSYSELDRDARKIAAGMLASKLDNGPVLLIFPTGPEFLISLLGTFYAGIVAAAMPAPRQGESQQRTANVFRNGKFHAILTTQDLSFDFGHRDQMDLSPAIYRYDNLVSADTPAKANWLGLELQAEAPLLRQYTSGSTQDPRGIVLNNRCLLANFDRLARRLNGTRTSCFVNWMPHYHDMGLIGNLLFPLYLGAHSVQMSPLTFMQRPLRWLRTFSRYHGNIGGSPPFGYDLCVDTVTPEQVAELDLSHWHAAVCGAEPVYRSTLSRFTAHFKPAGLSSRTIFAAYGLAESTLLVAGGNPTTDENKKNTLNPRTLPTDRAPCYLDTETSNNLSIVDPDTSQPQPDGKIGEIWLRGKSVAIGYDEDLSNSDSRFNATIAEHSDSTFLRTGDLGFVEGQQLFLTGRIKDTLIVNGTNFTATDIEWIAAQDHSWLNLSAAAAFHCEEADSGAVALLIESRKKKLDPALIIEAEKRIRTQVLEQAGLVLKIIGILPRGTLPKTSSGKVRRKQVRERFLDGTFSTHSTTLVPVKR